MGIFIFISLIVTLHSELYANNRNKENIFETTNALDKRLVSEYQMRNHPYCYHLAAQEHFIRYIQIPIGFQQSSMEIDIERRNISIEMSDADPSNPMVVKRQINIPKNVSLCSRIKFSVDVNNRMKIQFPIE